MPAAAGISEKELLACDFPPATLKEEGLEGGERSEVRTQRCRKGCIRVRLVKLKGTELTDRGHVCRVNFARKIFFRATNFLTKNAPKIFPEIFEPLFCGSEKNPGNSLQISH